MHVPQKRTCHKQLVGRCGLHPYLRQSASRKSPLCKANPYSVSGNTVSQLEAPFSLDKAIEHCKSWLPFSDNSCTVLVSLLIILSFSFLFDCGDGFVHFWRMAMACSFSIDEIVDVIFLEVW